MAIIKITREKAIEQPEKVTLELSTGDAELFKYFMKYYKQIERLEMGGVFEATGKTWILHTNGGGHIQKIEVQTTTFKG